MKKIFLWLFTLYCFGSWAQSDLEVAKEQLKQLKNGFILVRLKTNENSIKALEEKGFTKRAAVMRNEVYQDNRETLLSFYQTFDFCPVYFFYSDKSDFIRKGELQGNVFNHKLELVEESLLQKKPFFTAEFTRTEKLQIHALVLMDDFLLPLKAPFPFYQRRYIFFSLWKQGKGTVAEKLNKKLQLYYKRWHSVS